MPSPLLPLSHAPLPVPPLQPPQASSSSSSSSLPPPPLSSKALGKQRGPPLPAASDPPAPEEPKPRHVMIRFTGGSSDSSEEGGDLGLWVEPSESVRAVKRQIRSLRPSSASRHLRLIHAGRVLAPTVKLVPWLTSRTKAKPAGVETEEEAGELSWIHCAVGLEIEDGEGSEGEEGEGKEVEQVVQLRGFDTLRSTAGLSEADVMQMRREFHGLGEEDELDDSARNLEEQWIDGTMPLEAEAVPQQTYTSILHGLVTGFFFPLLPLFFFKDGEQHSFIAPGVLGGAEGTASTGVVFSRRMQVSLMLGLMINLSVGLLRFVG